MYVYYIYICIHIYVYIYIYIFYLDAYFYWFSVIKLVHFRIYISVIEPLLKILPNLRPEIN